MTDEIKKEETQETDLIAKANAAAERLEAANRQQEALLLRQEKLIAEQRLGGITQGGQAQEKPKELTPIEYAEQVRKGLINPLKVL